jgi:predicted anti-sigma-YlaC factor YlaD
MNQSDGTSNNCHEIDELMSGYLDNELAQGDCQLVEIHLEQCPSCRLQLDEIRLLKKGVSTMSFGEMDKQQWEAIKNDLPARASRGLGWILFIVSLVILIAYAIYEFSIDDTVPALVKITVAGLVLGLLSLFISVLRQRMIAGRSDRYKDIQI